MTKRYRKGADAERELKKQEETKGHYVMRSAGSKGLFDLCIFEKDRIRLVQVKTHGQPVDREALMAIQVPSNVVKEVWFKVPRRGFEGEVIE